MKIGKRLVRKRRKRSIESQCWKRDSRRRGTESGKQEESRERRKIPTGRDTKDSLLHGSSKTKKGPSFDSIMYFLVRDGSSLLLSFSFPFNSLSL